MGTRLVGMQSQQGYARRFNALDRYRLTNPIPPGLEWDRLRGAPMSPGQILDRLRHTRRLALAARALTVLAALLDGRRSDQPLGLRKADGDEKLILPVSVARMLETL